MTPDNIEQQLAGQLKHLKADSLDITRHNKVSLHRTLDAVEYYLEIYRNCIDKVLEMCRKSPGEMTLVDYGGGHGLLSVFAKRLGFGKVIYVDYSPESNELCRAVSQQLMTSPDVVLCGDAGFLKRWCEEAGVVPDAVIGIDVIEHVYVLDDFFESLHSVSPQIKMVFTTSSNPHNKSIVRRLHRVMKRDEEGSLAHEGFRVQRRDYIAKLYPDMPETMLDYWAENTRGLVFEDVARAVEAQSPNLLRDAYNTCDPVTGSWTERILPFDDYRQLLRPYGYGLEVMPGLYNVHRRGPKAWISRRRNKRIVRVESSNPVGFLQRRRYRKALQIAPFVYLIVSGEL